MIDKLINLANYLKEHDLKKESDKVNYLLKSVVAEYDEQEVEKQIRYFRTKVRGRPAYFDKKTGKERPRVLSQPLSVLAERHNGWAESQLMVYPHLKLEAVEILVNDKIQVQWSNPMLEDAQYMYFDLLTPDGRNLYQDEELVGENRRIERLAAEKTAQNFPNYFLESNYLMSSFPELVDNANRALSDVAYEDTYNNFEDIGEV